MMTTRFPDFDYSAEHARKVRQQNQMALYENKCHLFQTTRVESTNRTNADIVRSNPVVSPAELERAVMRDECAWLSAHRAFLEEKLFATERKLKALKKQMKTGEKTRPKTRPKTVSAVGRIALIKEMCGDDDITAEILKTEADTGIPQFHNCEDCERYCYTGGVIYPDGYTCADCDDEESDEDEDDE